jgi:hypothetical protein
LRLGNSAKPQAAFLQGNIPMTLHSATVAGVLRPDGTLELTQPIRLPPGPVEVTVKIVDQEKPDTMIVLKQIRHEQETASTPRRTKEEIDAYVRELRDELEEHILAAEELQRQCWETRKQTSITIEVLP